MTDKLPAYTRSIGSIAPPTAGRTARDIVGYAVAKNTDTLWCVWWDQYNERFDEKGVVFLDEGLAAMVAEARNARMVFVWVGSDADKNWPRYE